MNKIFKTIILLFLSTGLAITVLANDITFESKVDTNQLTMGQSTKLVLTIRGSQKVDPLTLPAIDGFETRYVGPQTEVSIVNGKYSTTKSFIYTLFPNKTGTFTIPGFKVAIDGQEYTSQPIEMKVSDGASADAKDGQQEGGIPSAQSLQEKIMLVMGTPSKEVYLYERVPLTIKLLFNGVTINDVQYPVFEMAGFSKDDFAQPQQGQEIINGVAYSIVEFKTFISPTRTGDVALGPAKIGASLLYRSADRNNPRSLFGNELFDSFFNTYEKRPFTVSSMPLNLKVLELPEEERPRDFSGAVGQFDFNVAVGPTDVKIGDPITLRMKISGDGNFKSMTMPTLNDPNFKTYDPQVKDEGNTRYLEQVIIPTSVAAKEVPAFRFSYFDTQEKKYKTIIQGPFSIGVTAPEPGQEFKVVGFDASQPNQVIKEELGRDIVFIKERLGNITKHNQHIFMRIWYWLFLVVYLVGWSAFLAVYLLRRRLKTDLQFARKFKAPHHARLGLKETEGHMQQGHVKEFYTSAIKTLQEYLGNQMHVPSAGMTFGSVERLLMDRQVNEDVVRSIKMIFETADMVRFASAGMAQENMEKTFESLRLIIDHLERTL